MPDAYVLEYDSTLIAQRIVHLLQPFRHVLASDFFVEGYTKRGSVFDPCVSKARPALYNFHALPRA